MAFDEMAQCLDEPVIESWAQVSSSSQNKNVWESKKFQPYGPSTSSDWFARPS
jgi:hypothetical protein